MFPTISGSRTSFPDSSEADYLLHVLGTPAGEMAVWSGVAAGNDARCDPPNRARRSTPLAWILVDDLDATAANVDEPLDPWPSTYALHQTARERRAEAVASISRGAAGAVRRAILRAWKRYRQHRETRRIYEALRGLDDRTLRDLGFHRSEILSVASEATGAAERTRARLLPRTPVQGLFTLYSLTRCDAEMAMREALRRLQSTPDSIATPRCGRDSGQRRPHG